MKVLLDENIDPRLTQDFPRDSEVTSVLDLTRGGSDRHWLEWAVENEYSVFVTGDTNLPHQQDLTSFPLAIVWFEGPRNVLEGLRPRMGEVNELLPSATELNSTIWVQEEDTIIQEVKQE
jgi:hypothetical protein